MVAVTFDRRTVVRAALIGAAVLPAGATRAMYATPAAHVPPMAATAHGFRFDGIEGGTIDLGDRTGHRR